MDHLSEEQLTLLRNALVETHMNLTEQLAINKSAAEVVNLDQSMVGRVSRMDAMQQQGMAVSTRDKAARRLRRIELALAALDKNEYGLCSQCDEAISYPRLQAQPEARLCIDCQSRADQQ